MHAVLLFFQTNLSFDYYSHDEQEQLGAKVKQLRIMSCIYGKDTSTASIVLFPCDIELKRSVESAKSGTNMEAKVTDIFLHLSATTCNIFLDVAEMIMKDGKVSKGKRYALLPLLEFLCDDVHKNCQGRKTLTAF